MDENKQAEPVARVIADKFDDGSHKGHILEWLGRNEANDFPEGTEFYTHPAPAVMQEPVVQRTLGYEQGIQDAAKMLDTKANDYAKEFGFDDMGALEFSRESQREYHSTLVELAEEVRSMEATNSAPAVAVKCVLCSDTGKHSEIFAGFPPEGYTPKMIDCGCQRKPAVAQEPVHFRAVICKEQQDQALGVVPKIVGFVDKKAAEQFILEKRDFQGWRYNLEPLYTEAPAVAHPPAEVVRELVRLTDDDLTKIYMRFVGHEGLSPRLFEDVAGCVMSAMISNNVPQCLTLNDHLLKALKDTDKVIERQLELIEQRAKGDFLNKRPVVQSLTAHRARIQKTLKSAKEQGL